MKDKYTKEEIKTPEQVIDSYTVRGVPMSLIPVMCKELKISEKKLMSWLNGQTMGLVGGEGLVYPWDIKRFINGLPNND